MKRFFSAFISIALIISFIPVLSLAETEDFFVAVEAEDCYNAANVLGGFEGVDDSAKGASGRWAMKAKNASGTNEPSVPPLCYEDLYIEKEGKYKLFIRSRGQDSIKYKVENANTTEADTFKTVWFSFETEEYAWALLGEIELCEGWNTLAFASYKSGLYFDKFIVTDSLLYYPVGTGQELSESNGLSDVYPKPAYYPPADTHPRLIINSEILENAKKHFQGGNKAVYNRVITFANRNETGLLRQNVSYNNYNNNALECAKANAFRYLITEDKTLAETYADKAITIMTNYMQTLKYNPPGSLMEIRGTGTAIVAASIVYDWCHDAKCFTAERKKALMEGCVRQAANLECGWPPVNLSVFNNSHGGENSIMKDMFSLAIAVYDEYPEIYDMVGGRIFNQYVPAINSHYERGEAFHRMGDDYGVYRYGFELYMKLLLEGIGCGDVLSENQRLMAYQHIIRTRPDGATFRDGDMWNTAPEDGVYTVMNTTEMSFLASYLFDDPYLKGFFNEQLPDPSKLAAGGDFSPVTYLLLNNPEQEMRSRTELPLAVYSGDESGIMTVRTGWDTGRNADVMAVSMKLPERTWGASHNHLDAGQFEIYYKGPLAIDGGIYQSAPFYDDEGNYITSNLNYGSDHNINYATRTIAHNTMLVFNPEETGFGRGSSNDGGQRIKHSFPHNATVEQYTGDLNKAGEVISVDIGEDLNKPSYTYQKADLTDWYSDKVEIFERSFMFLNFREEGNPGAVVVFDRVKSSDASFKKSWLLHSQTEPSVNGNVTVIERGDNGYEGILINQTLLPVAHTITKVGGEGFEYYVNGKNYNAAPQNEAADESGNWRIELSPEAANTEDYFLNVLTVSEAGNIKYDSAELLETDELYGLKINNKLCFFGKESEKIASDFEITVSGEENYDFLISNLSAGTWQITCGSEVKTATVTERGAVLSFEGKSGSYSFKMLNTEAEEKNLLFTENIVRSDAPVTETFPYYFTDSRAFSIFARATRNNGNEISGYGFLYTKNKNDNEKSTGARIFPAEKAMNSAGRFGLKLIDVTNSLKEGYIRSYVKYGEENYSLGNPVPIYEAYLSGIFSDGVLLEGFNKDNLKYKVILPYGWTEEDGFPEITAEAEKGSEIRNAETDAENMKTVITVARKGAIPEEKEYTVYYEISTERESVEASLAFGGGTGLIKDNKNLYSAFEQPAATVYNYSNKNYMNAFNMVGTHSNYTPVAGYMQLDLEKLGEIDTEKPVYLRLHSRFVLYDKKASNDISFEDSVVSVFDVSGFDWSRSLTDRSVAADMSVAEGKNPIASFSATEVPVSSDARIARGTHDVDITAFVKKCVEEGNMTPTLCFYVNKPVKVTNILNRSLYWLYMEPTPDKTYGDINSYIVYHKFD